MINASEVEEQLLAAGIPVTGAAVRGAEGDGAFHVFVEVRRDARGRREPSDAQLDNAKAMLHQAGVVVDFVLTDVTVRDAEAGLRAMLLHSFGASVRNCFLASHGRDAFVWIVPKRQIADVEHREIVERARSFLGDVGLVLQQLTSTTGENLPSKSRCLVSLRLSAPVAPPQLAQRLREEGFVVPSDDWMVRRLDVLRKGGMVIRMKSGNYALTLHALRSMGSVKGARSPDISRLLALARTGR